LNAVYSIDGIAKGNAFGAEPIRRRTRASRPLALPPSPPSDTAPTAPTNLRSSTRRQTVAKSNRYEPFGCTAIVTSSV
jgi:hypothetical protein